MLDHRVDPAEQLVRLYHERWEIECAFYSLRHTLLTGRVLRSGDPVGVEQEMWALLTTYQVLRIAMVAAIESAPGLDPDRASFTTALETARDLLTAGRGVVPAAGDSDLVGDIGRAVLSDLLPPRRLRTSIHKVKCPISRYPARPADNRPLTSQSITGIAITLYTAHDTPPPPQVRHRRSWSPAAHTPTPAPSRTPPTAGRQHRVLTILAAEPGRAWHGRELARMLGITNLNSFCVQLSQWSSEGIIRKTGRALYTLAGHASMPLTSADTA